MSLLIPRLSMFSLLDFGTRSTRAGAHSAVMTPVQRFDRADSKSDEFSVGWDLIAQEHRVRAAGARILHLFGEVLNFEGTPISGAIVDIRQCDANGREPKGHLSARDFLGVGRAVTDFEGRYQFRTILPSPDHKCTAHIEARVTPPTGRTLSTKLYLLDHLANETDWTFQALGPSGQAAVSLDPVERSDGDLDAGFNFVL